MRQLRQSQSSVGIYSRVSYFYHWLSFRNRVFQCGPGRSRTYPQPPQNSDCRPTPTMSDFLSCVFLISSLLKYVSPTSTCLQHRLACSVLGVTCSAGLQGHHNTQMKAVWAWATGLFMTANGFAAFKEVPARESHRIPTRHKSCLRMAVRYTCKC